MIFKSIILSFIILALFGCGGVTPKKVEKKQVKRQTYGVVLDKSEQLTALTNYLVKKELGIKKPNFPKKPQKPELLETVELVKGEYEKSDTFEVRVNAEKRKRANKLKVLQEKYALDVAAYNDEVKRLTTEYNTVIETKELAIKESKQKAIIVAYNTIYGKPFIEKKVNYDADTEKFYAKINSTKGGFSENVLISVPVDKAEQFQKNIKNTETKIVFDFSDEKLMMTKILIIDGDKTYEALPSSKSYKSSVASVSLENGTMHLGDTSLLSTSLALNSGNYAEMSYSEALTEGVNDIPSYLAQSEVMSEDKNKWLFIIGIEKYEFTDPVIYSATSAKEFKTVMKKRLGIPEQNVRTLIDKDATSAKIDYKLRDMLRRVKKGDTIYFYYSGHGIPVPAQNNEPFMLAQDMNPAYMQDERFKLENIYKALYKSNASKIFAFVDSCFSGGTDNQALIKGVAAARIKPKKVSFNQEKMLILSAGSGIQYSNKYDKKKNRLFSYYLMRGLINNNNDMQRLYDYVKSNVQEQSYKMGTSYEQVPVYKGNLGLGL